MWALRGPPPHFHTSENVNEGTSEVSPLPASWRQPCLSSSKSPSPPGLLDSSALRLEIEPPGNVCVCVGGEGRMSVLGSRL